VKVIVSKNHHIKKNALRFLHAQKQNVVLFLAIKLATATAAPLTADPRENDHVTSKLRAPEVPFTPTPPGLS